MKFPSREINVLETLSCYKFADEIAQSERKESYCPAEPSDSASAGDDAANDMSLEESFPELRVQTGMHVRDRRKRRRLQENKISF